MREHTTSIGTLIRSELLEGVGGVVHGFGVRKITHVQYLDALGVRDRFIVETDQMHGDVVHYLMWPKKGPLLEGDAFITDRPGIVCFVRTADCVPMLIADTKRPAVAAVHAGWRGTVGNIIEKTFSAMKKAFGTEAVDCVVAIGPGICGKCYEVGGEVVDELSRLNVGREWLMDANHVDIAKANRLLLEALGVLPRNIDSFHRCTSCDRTFNSWRRDRGEEDRQFNFIMLIS